MCGLNDEVVFILTWSLSKGLLYKGDILHIEVTQHKTVTLIYIPAVFFPNYQPRYYFLSGTVSNSRQESGRKAQRLPREFT